MREGGGAEITIIAKYKKLKAKNPINLNWNQSKPIELHVSINQDDYGSLEETDENLVYFVYGDNEKNISDYEPYKGGTIKGILDRLKAIEEKL